MFLLSLDILCWADEERELMFNCHLGSSAGEAGFFLKSTTVFRAFSFRLFWLNQINRWSISLSSANFRSWTEVKWRCGWLCIERRVAEKEHSLGVTSADELQGMGSLVAQALVDKVEAMLTALSMDL